MPNQYRMSYFMPPIAPVRNEQGRMVTPPTLLPFCEVSVEQVFQMITCNENLKLLTAQVRNAPDMRTAKAALLPSFFLSLDLCTYFIYPLFTYFYSPPLLILSLL